MDERIIKLEKAIDAVIDLEEDGKPLSVACKAPGGRLVVIGQIDKDGSPRVDDDWVFVECPVCKGTRKKPTASTINPTPSSSPQDERTTDNPKTP